MVSASHHLHDHPRLALALRGAARAVSRRVARLSAWRAYPSLRTPQRSPLLSHAALESGSHIPRLRGSEPRLGPAGPATRLSPTKSSTPPPSRTPSAARRADPRNPLTSHSTPLPHSPSRSLEHLERPGGTQIEQGDMLASGLVGLNDPQLEAAFYRSFKPPAQGAGPPPAAPAGRKARRTGGG